MTACASNLHQISLALHQYTADNGGDYPPDDPLLAHDPQRMRVRVTLPHAGRYTGDRFGPGQTYASAHSRVTMAAAPVVDLDVSLPPRESVQYILKYAGGDR